jgi:hypothetical protein
MYSMMVKATFQPMDVFRLKTRKSTKNDYYIRWLHIYKSKINPKIAILSHEYP